MTDRDKELLKMYEQIFQNGSPTLDLYDRITLQARVIFKDRNELYGDAFKETGVLGTFAVLAGDVARLRKMIYLGQDLRGEKLAEPIIDKLLDVINQAIITIMMLESNNWIGEEQE